MSTKFSTISAVILSAALAVTVGVRLASPTNAHPAPPTASDPPPATVAEVPAPQPAPETDPVEVGRRLFFDTNLSANGQVSCATCHEPSRAYTSGGKAPKLGGGNLALRSPTLLNRRDGKRFMWDGRAKSLEEQALMPITNPDEMGLTIADLESRTGMKAADVAASLAAFERTITHQRTAFDDYLDGQNSNIDPEIARGWQLFRGKGHCAACHTGTNLTDDQLHETFTIGKKFKTPGLRNVIHAGPYMHDGSVRYLIDLIERYNAGAGEAKPLGLTDSEVDDLYELLRAL
jgi:cytochrome c peroxidase